VIPEIAEAIVKKFNGDINLKNALTSGLFYQRASQGLTGNYGVFSFESISYNSIMGSPSNNIVNVDVNFDLYSDVEDGGELIAMLADLISACFYEQKIYIEGYNYLIMEDENILPFGLVDDVWQVRVSYRLRMQKE
jgi:hypothetical protein